MGAVLAHLMRLLALCAICAIALQLTILARIGLMASIDPQSSTMQRSEIMRILTSPAPLRWRQEWRDYADISVSLKRAVIASEDSGFANHDGVDWDALGKAWERNEKALQRAQRLEQRQSAAAASVRPGREPRLVGGSTITQQLAKNLFLSGERNLARKGQEFLVTLMLETVLDKRRILEIYLNTVEWGEGVFGAEAAAQHYFRTSAKQLAPAQGARLAVILPAPRRFGKRPDSPYPMSRADTILARMPAVTVP